MELEGGFVLWRGGTDETGVVGATIPSSAYRESNFCQGLTDRNMCLPCRGGSVLLRGKESGGCSRVHREESEFDVHLAPEFYR